MNRDALTAYVLAKKNGGGGGQGKDGKDGKDGRDGIDGKSAYEIAVDTGMYKGYIETGDATGGMRCTELANTDVETVEAMIQRGDYLTVANGHNCNDGDVIVVRAANDAYEGGVYVIGKVKDCVKNAYYMTQKFKIETDRSDEDVVPEYSTPYEVGNDAELYTDKDIAYSVGHVVGIIEGEEAWLESMIPQKGEDYMTEEDIEDIVQRVLDELANQ